MKAGAYSRTTSSARWPRAGGVRFLDESRDDDGYRVRSRSRATSGWGQFTSGQQFFTRTIAYHQDNTDYTYF